MCIVHDYLEKYGHGEKVIFLHANNGTAQNKSNASMQNLMWRILTGKNECIELSFMLTGHTTFSLNRYFGLLKKVFQWSSVSTLSDIALVVEQSTKEDQNLAQCIHGSGDETLITFYQWSEHLSKYFRTIPNILSYHNFRVTCEQPGVVYLRKFSEAQFNILKTNVDIEELSILPSKTHIPRLDLQHQWYLYEQIRPHCKSRLNLPQAYHAKTITQCNC